MNQTDPRLSFDLGQAVHRRGDPRSLGYVVAVMLVQPYQALVHWRSETATFEPLEGLVLQPLR
jgi:hypothetical protein